MIIAIASNKDNINELVDTNFGRCEWFCIINTQTKEYNFLHNIGYNKEKNAGHNAVQFLVEKNVNMTIAGRFGSKVINLLSKHNIQMVIPQEGKTLHEIINNFK